MATTPDTPPVAVVCAVLRREGRILVARRPMNKRLAGLWEFPGGKIDPGESPPEALHRELAEELRCSVEIQRALPPFTHAYDWGTIELHPFLTRLADDSPEPFAVEHIELRWTIEPELHALIPDMAPADVPLLDDSSLLFR